MRTPFLATLRRMDGDDRKPRHIQRRHIQPRPIQRSAELRQARRRRVEKIAARQEGVVARRQVFAAGLSRAELRANVAAGRWQLVGRHVVAVHTGVLTEAASLWAAQLSGGPRAQLDGASSLIAAGLRNFSVPRHRVSVPRGAPVFRDGLVDVRQTRRWAEADLAPGSLRRTRNEVAAVRGALWAVSDRQATLVLSMAVQQRLVSADAIGTELLRIRKAPRLALLREVAVDLVGGVQSLGELDFARECRRRGLPKPSRQRIRKGRDGRYYLDVTWDEFRLVVEIDGIHHTWVQAVVPDALRQNEVVLQDAVVLRVPLLGLRVAADEFFEQIERALRDRGWDGSVIRHAKAAQ